MSRLLPRVGAVLVSGILLASGIVLGSTPASASACPPASIGGPSVGSVNVGSLSVPIKRFTYPSGGVLNPPATNQVVGLSARHKPLLANTGTTVLAWHVRYGEGCPGTLNPILDLPVGGTFSITNAAGKSRDYRITERTTVSRGRYAPEWFRTDGPAQVLLVTCSDLRGGTFHRTAVRLAEPVTDDASGA